MLFRSGQFMRLILSSPSVPSSPANPYLPCVFPSTWTSLCYIRFPLPLTDPRLPRGLRQCGPGPPPEPPVATTVSFDTPLPTTPNHVHILQRLDVDPPTVPPSPDFGQFMRLLSASPPPSTPPRLPVSTMYCMWISIPYYLYLT